MVIAASRISGRSASAVVSSSVGSSWSTHSTTTYAPTPSGPIGGAAQLGRDQLHRLQQDQLDGVVVGNARHGGGSTATSLLEPAVTIAVAVRWYHGTNPQPAGAVEDARERPFAATRQ